MVLLVHGDVLLIGLLFFEALHLLTHRAKAKKAAAAAAAATAGGGTATSAAAGSGNGGRKPRRIPLPRPPALPIPRRWLYSVAFTFMGASQAVHWFAASTYAVAIGRAVEATVGGVLRAASATVVATLFSSLHLLLLPLLAFVVFAALQMSWASPWANPGGLGGRGGGGDDDDMMHGGEGGVRRPWFVREYVEQSANPKLEVRREEEEEKEVDECIGYWVLYWMWYRSPLCMECGVMCVECMMMQCIVWCILGTPLVAPDVW